MNIRSAIEEVLYYAGDATLLPCVPVQLEHALSTLRAWLDAQPAAPEPTERWEPVAEMRWLGGLHSFNDIRVIDGMILGVWLSAPGVPPVTANIELPADLRLCRRVEVTP